MEVKVSKIRLEQMAYEVKLFWHLYQLGVLTYDEVTVEVNARRSEMGFSPLTPAQLVDMRQGMERRGTL